MSASERYEVTVGTFNLLRGTDTYTDVTGCETVFDVSGMLVAAP
jgi:hypothetical protein